MKTNQHYKTEDFVLNDSFRKWIQAPDVSSENYWTQFLADHPETKTMIDEARQIVLALNPLEDEVPNQRIEFIWNKIQKSKEKIQTRILPVFVRYAAVFVLAFLLGSLGLYFVSKPLVQPKEFTMINVPMGEKSELTLADGTKVWLNSGTKLRFPMAFNSKARNVFVEGEAFFDVAKNKHKPFVVNTGKLNIEVLGTRFNVSAYPEDNEIVATLEEGKIVAYFKNNSGKTELRPGQQLCFSTQSNSMKLTYVNTGLYTSWKENMLRFENAGFYDVIKKMERWYDVKINVEEMESFQKKYNMTIKTESLREILNLISLTIPINYEISENKVFISKR